jgi:hypothetical protein
MSKPRMVATIVVGFLVSQVLAAVVHGFLLLWYAEQPWPGGLVVKQLGLELVSSLIIGVAIAFAAGSGKLTAGSVARVA